jgi:hypothetical protein
MYVYILIYMYIYVFIHRSEERDASQGIDIVLKECKDRMHKAISQFKNNEGKFPPVKKSLLNKPKFVGGKSKSKNKNKSFFILIILKLLFFLVQHN